MSAVYARCIRRFLYTLSRVEISVYAVYPDTCGPSYPYIFVYADVTVSEPVFFRARFSKMAASRNDVCSMLLGLLSSLIACLELNVAMLNLNFNYLRRRLSIMRLLTISESGIRRHRLLKRAGRQLARPRRRVETSSKQTRKPRIWRQNYRRLSFDCNAHALLTNPLRCPDTNRIRVDGRIRFVYATCGRRYFCIRIKKLADTKISGYVWTGP